MLFNIVAVGGYWGAALPPCGYEVALTGGGFGTAVTVPSCFRGSLRTGFMRCECTRNTHVISNSCNTRYHTGTANTPETQRQLSSFTSPSKRKETFKHSREKNQNRREERKITGKNQRRYEIKKKEYKDIGIESR